MSVPEQTPAQRKAQRDLVLRSSLLADTRAERHGVYPVRKRPAPVVPPVVLNVAGHAFVLPHVTENVRRSL